MVGLPDVGGLTARVVGVVPGLLVGGPGATVVVVVLVAVPVTDRLGVSVVVLPETIVVGELDIRPAVEPTSEVRVWTVVVVVDDRGCDSDPLLGPVGVPAVVWIAAGP